MRLTLLLGVSPRLRLLAQRAGSLVSGWTIRYTTSELHRQLSTSLALKWLLI